MEIKRAMLRMSSSADVEIDGAEDYEASLRLE